MFVISFFSIPFIVHSLQVDLYGILTLSGIVIGYFSFLEFGLGAATVKYIAQYLAQKQEEKISETFWSSLLVYAVLGSLGTAVIYFSVPFFVNYFFKIPADLKPVAIIVLKVGSFGFLISMLSSVAGGVIRAASRFDIFNRVTIGLGTLQVGLTVLLLILKYSLVEIVISNLFVQCLSILAFWRRANDLFPSLKKPAFSLKAIIRLFKFGGFVAVSGAIGPVLLNIEKIFLSALYPISSLTYYYIPFALMDKLAVIRFSFSSVLFPAFSYLQDSDIKDIRRDLHFKSMLYIYFISFFFIVFLIVFGKDFLGLWMGNDFAQRSTQILTILMFAGLINTLAAPSMVALQGLDKPHLPAFFHVIELILYLPLSYFLIRKLGGVGAAYAWVLRVSLDTFLLHRAACRIFAEPLLGCYGKLLRRGFIPSAFCILLFLFLKRLDLALLSPVSIFGIFLTFICYCSAVWFFGFDQFTRDKVKEFLGRRT